ncbi:hypothetical protein ML462_13980 [Gramella lutea]|uniref:Uncharacterized protein n=1 Tax=Christiangramia lutea TaxID=1607951 RepID=A0A9X1V4U2_9FLAO|nr:hypothetical protein [Christiangramia lutea]MCH4824280.1 hypothetical protein [Christiangramia lutea]
MIDKEYLDKLKDEDYIAWDSLVNDPMIVGSDSGTGIILPVIVMIILIGLIIAGFIGLL